MATKTKTRKQKTVNAPMPEGIINDDPKMLESFEIGDVSHQGDLMLVRIAELPKSAKTRLSHQLAEGNTQGSRHVITPRAKVYSANADEIVMAIASANGVKIDARYIGPVFVSPAAPTENDLSHPEHGNQGFPAGSVIACVYQRSLDSEEREQRVRD
jgi:hypothetical protein